MTIFSHALLSLVLVRSLGLQGTEIATAVVFGNLIDIDHLLVFAKRGLYEEKDGIKSFRKRAHTFLHEPISLIPVAVFSWWLGSVIPIVFWGMHIAIDHLFLRSEKQPGWPISKRWVNYGWVPLGHKYEWMVDAFLIGVLGWIWWWGN